MYVFQDELHKTECFRKHYIWIHSEFIQYVFFLDTLLESGMGSIL